MVISTKLDFYETLLQDRTEWNPVQVPVEKLKSDSYGVPETIERVLALSLCLEMPVGAWIGAAGLVEGVRLPPSAIALLKSNIKDETRHQKQFELAEKAYPVRSEIQAEAQLYADTWIFSPEHTLVKAKVLEVGIFLVAQALLRFFGGQALDRMAATISEDELRHCSSNISLCEYLNLTTSVELDRLRGETMSWLVADLTYPSFDKVFWLRQSDAMTENNEAPEMESLFDWTISNAFFEIDNRNLYY